MIVNLLKQIVAQLQALIDRTGSDPALALRIESMEERMSAMEVAIGDITQLPTMDGAEDPQGDLDSLPKL